MDCQIVLTVILVMTRTLSAASPECKVTEIDGYLVADCSYRELLSVPTNLDSGIQKLDLTGNLLYGLLNSSFAKYMSITNLTLKHNKIKTIEVGTFTYLKKLKVLDISRNKLRNISKVLVQGIFEVNKNLTLLDLRRNMKEREPTEQFKYPGKALTDLTNLSHLYMDMAPVPYFGPEFGKLRNLKVLAFDLCLLEKMSNDMFKYITDTLEELHLMECHSVNSVDNGFLSPFKNLKVLNLADSNIHLTRALALLEPLSGTKMDVINFQHVSSAKHDVDSLPYNLAVTSEMMKYLRTICVKTINLSDNGIVDFRSGSLLTYDFPQCFENIVLSSNRITFETDRKKMELLKLTSQAKNVSIFDFSYNPVRSRNEMYLDIPNGAVRFIPKYARCKYKKPIPLFLPENLRFSRISHAFVDICGKRVIIQRAPSLEHLDISRYYFQEYSNLTINSDIKLKILNLSGIGITLFTQYHLLALKSLETLDLSHNGIPSLPNEVFGTNSKISELDLSHNLLIEVPLSIKTLSRLKLLNLKFNSIVAIDRHMTQWFASLTTKDNITIALEGNLLSCSCEHRDFIRWIYDSDVRLDKKETYKCRLINGTTVFADDVYKDYHGIFSDCSALVWMIVGITLLVTCTVVMLIVAIVFNFRWRIAYFIYRKFRKVIEKDMQLPNYSYDAYLIYAREEAIIAWIQDKLIPKLEKEWDLSVCEDVTPGTPLVTEIEGCVNKSRHVIIILTPDLLTREEVRFEIDTVQRQHVENHVQVTVLNMGVRKEDVPGELSFLWDAVYLIDWNNIQYPWYQLKTRLYLQR